MKSARATMILRLPPSLHRQLKQAARSADMSLNEHCRALLSRREKGASSADAPVSLGGQTGPVALSELVTTVRQAWEGDLDGLVLFGSFARGRPTGNSDIDLLIVLNPGVTLDRDLYSRWRLRRFEGRELAPLFVRIPGAGERIGGLWFEVALDGVVLYDRDLKLSRFLSHVRHLIADGRARRMVTHGHPYWVHDDAVAQAPPGGRW